MIVPLEALIFAMKQYIQLTPKRTLINSVISGLRKEDDYANQHG
jgi:hypothetical protein